jgi:hypothetical protein
MFSAQLEETKIHRLGRSQDILFHVFSVGHEANGIVTENDPIVLFLS